MTKSGPKQAALSFCWIGTLHQINLNVGHRSDDREQVGFSGAVSPSDHFRRDVSRLFPFSRETCLVTQYEVVIDEGNKAVLEQRACFQDNT